MSSVTVSPKYQVVIPRSVQESMGLRPGQKLQVLEFDGRIELIPEKPVSALRGLLAGADIRFERETDRS
jgi:AbrB family looped-hinge helix DNA binding protein